MKRFTGTILFVFLLVQPACFAQVNPFFAAPQKQATKQDSVSQVEPKPGEETELQADSKARKAPKQIKYPVFIQKFFVKITAIQRQLQRKLSGFARDLKTRASLKSLSMIFSIAFLYGLVHALGPGHGKILIVAFFLSEKPEFKKGIVLGVLFPFLHAGSAVVLVLFLKGIFKLPYFQELGNASQKMVLISYGLIVCIGLYIFVKNLMVILNKSGNKKEKIEKASEIPKIYTYKDVLSIAVALGIIPCPGTMILLLFSMSLGILYLGIPMALFMAIGMAVTISIIGLATIFLNERALSLFVKNDRRAAQVQKVLGLIGPMLIIFVGSFFFIMFI